MSNFCSPGPILTPIFPSLSFAPDPFALFNPFTGIAPRSMRPAPWTGPACVSPAANSGAEPDLSFLFRMCLDPKRGLDQQSYERAATLLGVEVATIQAVAKVETSGNAFDEQGRPRILYERHYFHRLTHGRYDHLHPDISNALRGGYGTFSAQYGKLQQAYRLDPVAALQSASWGRFQIMGKNFHAAGYSSVQRFVLALTRSEANHLQAFANFVKANQAMHEALKQKKWATFAQCYNGSSYKENNYDSKLEKAYNQLTSPR
ncbi:MAG TPA: N-acetylmuramidase family protein [Rhodanobacter sp.]|nr:N-acetylmuramidase family protein [Rhodanobacter sp.]